MKDININQVNKQTHKKILSNNKILKGENMEKLIEEYINKIFKRAEREVPEYGDFAPVYEQFTNPDKSLSATDFMLKISKPPKSIAGHEKIRNLEVVAYRLPTPYKAERIVATGDKDNILKQLQNPEIIAKIQEAAKSLSHNLEDI